MSIGIAKIVLLASVAAIAMWAAFPLIESGAWMGLAVVAATTAGIFYLYLGRRRVPAKYLLPGTLLLVAFQVVPIAFTVATAFTNAGDGHRGSKQDAIAAIQTASVVRTPGSRTYALSVAARGDPATGSLVFLLTDVTNRVVYAGDREGLARLPAGRATVAPTGEVTAADGYTVLRAGQVAARSAEVTRFVVPTGGHAGIRSQGLSRAYEGRAGMVYDGGCDCVREIDSGRIWRADPDTGSFVAADGQRLVQGWRVNVGLRNVVRVLTDPDVSGPFLRTLVWNVGFAGLSVLVTFALGLACALVLHSDRMGGRSLYRMLLILPYAMPSFAMLLVWRDLFNTEYGLVNGVLGWSVDWFGGPWSARAAVIAIQAWLGYPYMLLVATGALQAIPRELTEASMIDGATPWQSFRRVTLPLLLIALAPLLVSSFAYNFNNFNAIYLTTEGGPFPAGRESVGGTDLLITYTYRLAFGAAGAQYGFAAAISLFIFTLVALISVVSFRRVTRELEAYR